MIVLHIASQTSMKLTGPDASAPTPRTERALGPQRREVVPDAAPLLQRQRGLAHIGEDRAHIVADPAHDKAVEKGYAAPRPGARKHPARRG